MKRSILLAATFSVSALLISCSGGEKAAVGNAPQGDIPYSLTLQGFHVDGLPGLHSFVAAGEPSKLVLIGGRTNGMHGFPPNRNPSSPPSFPQSDRNTSIYVVDLPNHKLLGQASVLGLPEKIANQLASTNAESAVKDDWLYIVGGYGLPRNAPGTSSARITTLPRVTAIRLSALTEAVTTNKPLDATFVSTNIATAEDLNLAVTGGALKFFAGRFLLIFGHNFDGAYTAGGGTVIQEYTNTVRVLDMNASDDGGKAQVKVSHVADEPDNPNGLVPSKNPFHRRDLPVDGSISPDGAKVVEGITAYGGVFKPGGFEGYVSPIRIAAAQKPAGISAVEDTGVVQLLSQYECATIPVYSEKLKAMFTTLFAGISQFFWKDGKLNRVDANLAVVPPVDGLPFIDSVSTLKTSYKESGSATGQYIHLTQTFPPADAQPMCDSKPMTLLGANSKFIAAGTPHYGNEVLKLDELKATSTIGYIVGGIATNAPFAPETSCASDWIYTVTLDPTKATETQLLKQP